MSNCCVCCEVCGQTAAVLVDLQSARNHEWHKAALCSSCRDVLSRAVACGHDTPSLSPNIPLRIAVASFSPMAPEQRKPRVTRWPAHVTCWPPRMASGVLLPIETVE